MITLTNLTTIYDNICLNFTAHIQAGERVAILGPSGSGKSTFLKLIAGFIFSQTGSLILNAIDHQQTPPAKRPVSMLFQDNNLFAHLSVKQNLGLGFHPGLKLTTEQQQKKYAIAHRVGISDCLQRLPGELSGGQRQRVALARSLIRQQPILLLDEPFSALDPARRYDMFDLVNQICDERNITLLMVSHHLDDARHITPRSLVIVDGKISYDGSTQALLNNEISKIFPIVPC